MNTEQRVRTLLADLGKATLRGVRKCPKCGTYNGSRGIHCKNKDCDAVFKESSHKRKSSTDACKLTTGSAPQVFSVKIRDKGSDHRGFVQLPTIVSSSDVGISQSSALCFVDNCEKSFNNSVLRCHEKDASSISPSTCQHIQAALRCYAEAQPLTLRNSVLSSLNIDTETKQEIWALATATSGPLVQRVSKNIMAMKCKASSKHPLGYLHFIFFTTKVNNKIEHKFSCGCGSLKTFFKASKEDRKIVVANQCIHFYTCIWAFASDPKLSEEFEYYMNLDRPELRIHEPFDFELNSNAADKFVEMEIENLSDDTHLLIFREDPMSTQNLQSEQLDIVDIDNLNLDPSLLTENYIDHLKNENHNLANDPNMISEIHNLEVIDQNAIFDGSTIRVLQDSLMIDTNMSGGIDNHFLLDNSIRDNDEGSINIFDNHLMLNTNNIRIIKPNFVEIKNEPIVKQKTTVIKRKREENKRGLVRVANFNSIESKRNKVRSSQIVNQHINGCENIDETTTNLPFIIWLSSITERINQTMHYQFDGKPEPLVFQVPQNFFECLRERMSCGAKKKRLPNSTTAFTRRDGVPLGTFTKYTWLITNILHVKSIFETPLVPLEVTRSFVRNPDGTYEVYKREETEIDKFKKTSNTSLIKPLELKTYLKVGNTSPDQVQPTPFLIEWIPDILPISKIGELRIQFEFGHVKNESGHRWKKIPLTKSS